MQEINLYLRPHQECYLKSIHGDPPHITAKFNISELIFSVLRKDSYYSNDPVTIATVPDWVFESSNGKHFIGPRGHKVIGDYIDSILDLDLTKFLAPYHKNNRLLLKDGIYLFIDQHNLPNNGRMYETLKKRDYRARKKIITKNPADLFSSLSSICPQQSFVIPNGH